MVPLFNIVLQRCVTPTFIDWSPSENAWVVDVPFYGFEPLLIESLDIFLAEFVRVCHFSPNNISKSVGPIKKYGVLYLLMFTATVESHVL
jgi:hypothetical protein